MTHLALNLLLALLWAAVLGSFDAATLLAGFAVGFVALLLASPVVGRASFHRRTARAVAFVGFYLYELVASSLRVARDVLSPRARLRPAVFGMPLDARTDAEITVVASLISLTPGTLSLDVSPDRRVLWVHAMHVDDIDQLVAELKGGIERRVLSVLRPEPAAEEAR